MKYKLTTENFTKDYGENLLKSRGIDNVKEFLHPAPQCLQNPFDLENMDKAVDHVNKVLSTPSPQVLLIVDCDCDGFTSSAIIYQYLKKINSNCEIDWLLHEGKQHGLEDKIDLILNSEKKYDLLIIPDAGSNDYKYIEQLKSIDLFVIVLDHHILESEISDNCIIVNNQSSPQYNNKNLSGAGVAFQFCRAFDVSYSHNYANDFIDLAALGVCGDVMSALSLENQYIWRQGFSNIKNLFFQTLLIKQAYSIAGRAFSSEEEILDSLTPTPISVAFYIVPLINAMIRIGTMDEKKRLFLAFIDGERLVPCNKRGAKGTMEKVAIESARECTNVKKHQDDKKKAISEQIEIKIHKQGLLDNKILFIRLDEEDVFSSELTGLVCMQLSQKYSRPTILARLNDKGFIRGSIRGLNQSELTSFKDFLDESGFFEYVSGHDNAAGCSIHNKNLVAFHQYANEKLALVNFDENIHKVDFIRKGTDKDIFDIIFDLERYKNTWGPSNPEAIVAVEDIFVRVNDIRIMGKNKDTLKFEKNGVTYLKFFAKDLIEQLHDFDEVKITLVGKTNVNEWMGRITPQIFIEDLEFEDARFAF